MGEKRSKSSENVNSFRNGIILNLDKRMDEVLKGIGKIQGDIEALRNDGDRRSDELNRVENKLSDGIKNISKRLDQHLKAHYSDVEIMGIVPFIRKYFKRHWRFLVVLFVVGQIVMTCFALKLGIEKFSSLILKGW